MKALLLVDIQNDFTPGEPGAALAVPDGDAVIDVANRLIPQYDLVVATQDWHPPGHNSFASQHEGHDVGETIEWKGLEQILWPDHCVQGSKGAEFCDDLNMDEVDHVIQKGTDPDLDSYSGFYDNGHEKATGLAALLRDKGVDAVDIVGLALDVCVKFTALDAVKEGFDTTVILEGCRAVNLNEGDDERAKAEMREAGVKLA